MKLDQKSQKNIWQVEMKITGQVHGVFFRNETKKQADGFGLTGFVRNEADGSVFIVAVGKKENLQKLIEWARVGTQLAKVQNAEVTWKEVLGDFNKFEIK